MAAGKAASLDSLIEQALRERRELSDAHRELVEQAYASVGRGAVVEEADADALLDRWIAEDAAGGK
ncbi:MAG: hypothetical protein AB7T59_07220 [Hyphomonadaceae bacterium]